MRVSSNQIFDTGSLGIQRNQSSLFKLQNQLSTGRRVLAPEDDPIAASQALVISQAKAINSQHIVNQGNAKSQLASLESQLDSVTKVLQNVRERTIQGGNTTLTNSDRQAIASEIDSRLQELIGIANAQDGTGQYLFSGFRGATLPFSAAAGGQIIFSGDDGERLLQISDSRQIPINASGSEVFMRPLNGNGSFVTTSGGNQAVLGTVGGNNQGTAISDAGSVTDLTQWNNASNPGNLMVRFSVAAGVTTYTLYDNTVPAAPVALTAATPFTPGQTISLQKTTAPAANYGAQIVVTGSPADGDTFTMARSSTQSMFETLQNISSVLRSAVGTTSFTAAEFTNRLGAELTNLDRALDNVGRITAAVGTRLQEIDSLNDTAQDVGLLHDETLSNLQDLDYAKAISDFTRQQFNLEAAQKSFAKISQLSLFSIL